MSSTLRIRLLALAALAAIVPLCVPPAAAPAQAQAVLDGVWSPLEYPHPGVRQGTAVAYDAGLRRLYLFGGYDGAFPLNDTWVFDVDASAWTQLHPAGARPEERQYHSLVFDPVRHRLLLFGGYDHAPLGDLWALTLDGTPAWTQLGAADSTPSARFAHSSRYDPVRDRMLVFGGTTPAGPSNETWALSLGAVPAWTRVATGGAAPAPRAFQSAVYDPAGDALVVFGGFGGDSTQSCLGDVWRLDLAAGTWAPVTTTGPAPAPRDGHVAVYDPSGPRMLVFGGNCGTARLDDVWALSLGASPAWDSVATSGPAPAPRFLHAAVIDTAQERLLVLSGVGAGGVVQGDTWNLDLSSTPTWTELVPSASLITHMYLPVVVPDPVGHRMIVFGDAGNSDLRLWSMPLDGPHQAAPLAALGTQPPRLWGASAAYDTRRQRVVIFGGAVGPGTATVNDTWALTLWPTPSWEKLAPVGTPPEPRMGHTAIYDPALDRMVVTGGFLEAGSITAYPGVFALEFSSDSLRWRRLELAGGVQVNRTFASAVYDSWHDRMVLYGGAEAGTYGDVWALSLGDSLSAAWTQLLPAGTGPVNRRSHTAVFDGARDRMVVYGGNTERFWSTTGTDLSDVWSLSLDGPVQWSEVALSGVLPGARCEHAAFYDTKTDRMVVYGGTVDGTTQDDSWQLGWTFTPAAGVGAPAAASLAIQGIRPNPVRADAPVIAFTLPVAAPARLDVFDVTGRRVTHRDLPSGAVGPQSVRLDFSARLGPGLYFVRVEQAGR
ncbi:MAG TPA: kelch repeat-containing protein, partial [Frankiaceae bacterium]|nr:kelch repeat-containing protein [Frankiaceae bacterium]